MPADLEAGTSLAGGLIAVTHILLGSATGQRFTVHQRGRSATLSFHLGHWMHLSGIHVDPGLTMRARRRLLTHIWQHLSRQEGIKFLLGDFNFVAGGESRFDGVGKPTTDDSAMATFFDELFECSAELHQPDMTFHRMVATSAARESQAGLIVFIPRWRRGVLGHCLGMVSEARPRPRASVY